MKNFVVLIAFSLCSLAVNKAQAQIFSQIYIAMTTGSDDLRSGNDAYISLNFADGTSSDEVSLTRNPKLSGSYDQGGVVTGIVEFQDEENVNDVIGITIRHDGRPRPGNPFDTYDNWDLKAIRISALTDNSGPRGASIYNSRNDPARRTSVIRFTGDHLSIVLPRQ